jgi:hypothetical protein
MLGWLSLRCLSSCHHRSMCQLVIMLPLDAPPSSLPQLVVTSPCRFHCLSTCRLIVPLPLIMPPSCLPRLDSPAPLVAPLPLIVSAGCHAASHHATLSFDSADCHVTPCCRHHHPSQSRRRPATHCAVTADAHCNCAANVEFHCVNVLPSFPSLLPTIMAIAAPHITILLPSHPAVAPPPPVLMLLLLLLLLVQLLLLLLLPLGALSERFPPMKPHDLLLRVLPYRLGFKHHRSLSTRH